MTLTGAHVERVLRSIPGAYGRQVASMDALASGANEALRTAPAGLTQQGAAAFLATMSQESASFRYLSEAGSSAYLRSKAYWPFVGRTFEQVTHQTNYAAFGAWCFARTLVPFAATFVRDPESLSDIRWAWLGGVWYWSTRPLWGYANKGDFLATQQLVNIGHVGTAKPAGYAARLAWYQAWLKLGADLLPGAAPTKPSAPAEPAAPAAPIPTSGKRPIDMADATDKTFSGTLDQPLTPGENVLWLGPLDSAGNHPLSLLTKVSAGVDLTATLDIRDAAPGIDPRVDRSANFASTFRTVSYSTGALPVTISDEISVRGDQVRFAGAFNAVPAKGKSNRLRLIITVPDGVTGLVLHRFTVKGWAL